MKQEQPPTIEEEPTLENIKEYFEEEKNYYLNRDKIIDSALHLKAAERGKILTGYEKYKSEDDKKPEKIPGILKKFENGEYECGLYYIEKILGGGGAEQGGRTILDLINHKEYVSRASDERSKDMETQEYQNRKNYLRKLADVLAGEIYKKRESELDKKLSAQEKIEICEHIANRTGEDISQIKEEFTQGNYRKALEFLDEKIYKLLKELGSEDKKEAVRAHRKDLFTLRRHRRYFLNYV